MWCTHLFCTNTDELDTLALNEFKSQTEVNAFLNLYFSQKFFVSSFVFFCFPHLRYVAWIERGSKDGAERRTLRLGRLSTPWIVSPDIISNNFINFNPSLKSFVISLIWIPALRRWLQEEREKSEISELENEKKIQENSKKLKILFSFFWLRVVRSFAFATLIVV